LLIAISQWVLFLFTPFLFCLFFDFFSTFFFKKKKKKRIWCLVLLRKLWERIQTENFDVSCERLEGFGSMALRRASSILFNKLKLNLNPNLNNVAHRNLSTGTFPFFFFKAYWCLVAEKTLGKNRN
jgi:hypothetical protein